MDKPSIPKNKSKLPISWNSCTNWNWIVLKSNNINTINDKNKFNIDILKPITLIFFNVIIESFLATIPNTPIRGIKSKYDNTIYKKKFLGSSKSIMKCTLYLTHHKYIKVNKL